MERAGRRRESKGHIWTRNGRNMKARRDERQNSKKGKKLDESAHRSITKTERNSKRERTSHGKQYVSTSTLTLDYNTN